ncbi:MAG: hypothetical protein JOZ87_14580 [Chloroflexi bacterium]|nr:hypothetical protein [Chloroflexota bacterium]
MRRDTVLVHARRGLVSPQTHQRLRAIAVQHLVPHHELELELLSTMPINRMAPSRKDHLR